MIKFLLPVILLLPGLNGVAQKDSVRRYLDAELHFTTKKDFVYAAMSIKSEDHWILYAVYPDTSVLMKIYFKDAALTVKDGPFMLYHPKKVLAQQGYFKNNIPNGYWKAWYPDGQLKNEGDIINNHLSGIWKGWYKDGHVMSERSYIYSDSMIAGQPVHENSPASTYHRILDDFAPESKLDGPTTTWFENGSKESVLNYRNDSLSGLCTWFRPNGNPSSKETYVNGKVTELECYDEDGKYTGASCSILKQPVFIHPVFNALDYIEDELHKEKHKEIKEEGEAEVNFTVTQKGAIANLVILKSPDPALSKQIIRIFAAMPRWSPAITHNRTIDYPVKLVVPYYRN
jgi:antitoxin component YwqK of YwqJK toxin-antitoxin module